ncbi:MAG: ABC transporter substrate-binding protein [Beijerinckiaceae bacterium]
MGSIRSIALGLFLGLSFAAGGEAQIAENPVRLVVMNDQSGAYSDNAGKGSVVAAQLAIDDFGGKVAGVPIEVVGVDDQNKPDIAAAQARKEIETDQAAALFDFANTGVSLVVQEIAKEHNKVAVHVGSASADLYGKACSPTGAMWLYDTYSLVRSRAAWPRPSTTKTTRNGSCSSSIMPSAKECRKI